MNILIVGLVVTWCLYIRDGYHEPITDNFFHLGFSFDMKYFKNAKTVRFVAGWHMVKLS